MISHAVSKITSLFTVVRRHTHNEEEVVVNTLKGYSEVHAGTIDLNKQIMWRQEEVIISEKRSYKTRKCGLVTHADISKRLRYNLPMQYSLRSP